MSDLWPGQLRFVDDPSDAGGWFLRQWWHHAAETVEVGHAVQIAWAWEALGVFPWHDSYPG